MATFRLAASVLNILEIRHNDVKRNALKPLALKKVIFESAKIFTSTVRFSRNQEALELEICHMMVGITVTILSVCHHSNEEVELKAKQSKRD